MTPDRARTRGGQIPFAALCLCLFTLGLGEAATAATKDTPDSVAAQAMPAMIVGGSIAPAGAYPFFTALKLTSNNNQFCGGTLVSSVWVLTAAHCVDQLAGPAQLKLVIGASQLSPETGGDIRSVSEIHLHPSFNPATNDNDVALLHLNTPSTKRWARLAEPGDPVNPGNFVRAIGHGITTQGAIVSNDLRQVDLPVQSDAAMNASAYGSSFHGAVMIGAGPMAGGQGVCTSDSGGPLFIAAGSQARLVGDTSWDLGCAQANAPGIYGEVYQGALRTFVNSLVTRPSNDNFPGTVITGADGSASGTNTDATGQAGDPIVAGNSADTSVWYSWTAPENGPTSFNTRDASFNTTIGVYTGIGLAAVATNNDFNGVPQSKVTFNATAGTPYRIQVGGLNAEHGSFRLQWAQNSPAHDNFAAPAAISGVTGSHFSSSARSTGEPGEPDLIYPSRTVWYSWTAPESGTASFNTRGADFDTFLVAYTGTAITGLTHKANNTDTNGTPQSRISFAVTAGTNYRIAVNGWAEATGSIGLQWTIAPPANDHFADATALTGTYYGTKSGTTVRSTGEPGEPEYHAGVVADNSVWYSWTPAHSAPSKLRLRSVAGGLIPGMAVYTGSVITGLTAVADGPAEVSFNTVAGTTYRIAVDGFGGTVGTFQLEYIIGKCDGLNATIFANGGTTTGTAFDDVIVGSTVSETINGGDGNDTICGYSGNDTMSGDQGNDRMYGSLGNDWFKEGTTINGADRMQGDAGTDYVFYNARTTTAVNVTIDASANDGQAGESDYVTSPIEVIYGSTRNDIMQGGAGAEELRGGAGNDTLRGGGGNDSIIGGPGNDILRGEANNDALDLSDGVSANDDGDGGTGTDTAVQDAGDTVTNVP